MPGSLFNSSKYEIVDEFVDRLISNTSYTRDAAMVKRLTKRLVDKLDKHALEDLRFLLTQHDGA